MTLDFWERFPEGFLVAISFSLRSFPVATRVRRKWLGRPRGLWRRHGDVQRLRRPCVVQIASTGEEKGATCTLPTQHLSLCTLKNMTYVNIMGAAYWWECIRCAET